MAGKAFSKMVGIDVLIFGSVILRLPFDVIAPSMGNTKRLLQIIRTIFVIGSGVQTREPA